MLISDRLFSFSTYFIPDRIQFTANCFGFLLFTYKHIESETRCFGLAWQKQTENFVNIFSTLYRNKQASSKQKPRAISRVYIQLDTKEHLVDDGISSVNALGAEGYSDLIRMHSLLSVYESQLKYSICCKHTK